VKFADGHFCVFLTANPAVTATVWATSHV